MSNEPQPDGERYAGAPYAGGPYQGGPYQGAQHPPEQYAPEHYESEHPEGTPHGGHPQPYAQHLPAAASQGWGGGYDTEATSFVHMPDGPWPTGPRQPQGGSDGPQGEHGAYGTGEFDGGSPLAAPGTGQGGYTPPPMEPGAPAAPMTPAATVDPSSTGQWTLPFAERGTDDAPGAAGAPEPDAHGPHDADGAPGAEQGAGGAAMGQGAAAALAGSHEARTQRRPLGAGGAAAHGSGDGPGDGAYDGPDAYDGPFGAAGPPGGYGPGAQSAAAWAPPAPEDVAAQDAHLADGLARRQVPFAGAGPGAQPVPGGTHWPDPSVGTHGTPGELPAEAAGPYAGPPGVPEALGGGAGPMPGGLPGEAPGPTAHDHTPPEGVHTGDIGHQLGLRLAGQAGPAPVDPASVDAVLPGPPPPPGGPLPAANPPAHGGAPGGAPRWDGGEDRTDHARADDSGEYHIPVPPTGDAGTDAAAEEGAADEPSPDADADADDTAEAAEPEHADAPDTSDTPDVPGADHAPGDDAAADGAPAYAADPDGAPAPEAPDGHPAVPEEPAPAVLEPTVSQHPHTSYVLHVNGADRPVTGAWLGESLLYVLRERLGLAGAKDGCSQGECGACSVLVDGRLVASCLVPAATSAGSDVRTVEGLAVNGAPSDVQRALTECGAVQCGFCVPGLAMAVHDLLEGNHTPTELETRQAISGNLCRCSGYRGVLDAVRTVVAERAARTAGDDGPARADGGNRSADGGPGPDDADARIPHQAPPGGGGVHQGAHPHPHHPGGGA
ncbi:2Fe-2S iron-sulfur cluster-binding protein [Streptomyces phytohabitans]|uniref:2Fe-2S iron-sulfur cluster-binding protein n=1 Tax=Streptomyces phytohabitans TaxID=1150371 RepID=UPI00345C3839